ncbi:Calcium/calmodulin-dependent protein kinase type I [Madurella mycetomatis]|uniref:Calcium/calmodulin-dependent protein kinase type I n=1 Tax=Madurella mycetomatis TaxID=100816 RepID=A0A175W235_9PEZI|nr:Calcium/calmodulin-dependent protein kinase type I [Madurella mycetomatis]
MNTAPASGDRPQPQIQPCRYKVGKTLGAGSYSVVKECVHIDTGRYYAAKVINKRLMAGREHMVRNEIAVLKKVSMGHQNILTLVDYFETMNNLYLVTDLALGGELFDRICRKGSYYESDAADLIRATLSAVAYLHDHGIVHRDLKPENLLFRTPEDNADLLIADFGLSRIMDEEQFHVLTTTCGTPGYMAPEIFKKTGHGKPVDLWALGVITYFLLCGYTPFDRDSDFEEMQAILNADYSFTPLEYWRGVSDSAKDFIRRCLTIDPNKRMTAHEALQHPFVAGWARAAAGGADADKGQNLLPTVKKNFNARRTLHAAIDTVRAINKLREGQAGGFMNGLRSQEPRRDNQKPGQGQGQNNQNQGAPHKDDSGLSTGGRSGGGVQSGDSGYGTQVTDAGGDVRMDDAPAPSSSSPAAALQQQQSQAQGQGQGQLPPVHAVPASLRPGSEVNKVVETSKGLWSGPAGRR